MEGNFGRDTYRSGYAAAPLISSTPVSHNHPLYRPCRIRQDDFCSSTKIAARYSTQGNPDPGRPEPKRWERLIQPAERVGQLNQKKSSRWLAGSQISS